MFPRDVPVAMLVFLNNGTAAMLVYPANPPGIELYYHANILFLFWWKYKVTDHMSKNTLYFPPTFDMVPSRDVAMHGAHCLIHITFQFKRN